MKSLCSRIAIVTLIGLVAGRADGAISLADLKSQAASPDPALRASALLNLQRNLATQAGWDQAPASLAVAAAGLNDGDLGVRRAALAALLMGAYRTLPVINSADPNAAVFSGPGVQASLLKATSDPDAATRQTALEVYSLAYKLNPDVEGRLIMEFQAPDTRTPGQPSTKEAMLEMLMIGRSPSPKAADFLARLLDDPKYGDVVAERIRADQCPLPGLGLAKLGDKLASEKDPDRRVRLAGAIGAYGKDAAQLIPQLKAALAAEKNVRVKREIQGSIDKIQ
jgi:hypothetical protein